MNIKPKVLLLPDKPGWAFDVAAQQIRTLLAERYDFDILYVGQNPKIDSERYDLVHVFFWGETYHLKFINPQRTAIVKEVSSHRWQNEAQYGLLAPDRFVQTYLRDADLVTVTSRRLEALISPFREVQFVPNGFDPATYFNRQCRQGPLRIGWAGNKNDGCKGLNDTLVPAVGDNLDLFIAGGALDQNRMADFYNYIDLICIASTAEGEPLTLLESMACGCFPVCVDVGIVPEFVKSGVNGFIVDRKPEAFGDVFRAAQEHVEAIRLVGNQNAIEIARQRTWKSVAKYWDEAFELAIARHRGSKT